MYGSEVVRSSVDKMLDLRCVRHDDFLLFGSVCLFGQRVIGFVE